MKTIFLALLLFLSFNVNALAANCVAVAFHDPTMAPPNDIQVIRTTDWNELNKLSSTLAVIRVVVLYDNPLGNHVGTGYVGFEQFALSALPATASSGMRKRLEITRYNKSPEEGKKSTWRESLNSSDPVGLKTVNPPNLDKTAFLRSNDINFLGVDVTIEGYDQLTLDAITHADMQPGTC